MPGSKTLRQIGFSEGVALIVGSIVGSGLFAAPAIIADFSPTLWGFAIVWLLGGTMCLVGARIYGNLGLLYPEGGGPYVYLKKTVGPEIAELYGWMSLVVICPTMIAGLALFFGTQMRAIAPGLSELDIKLLATGIVILFTWLNARGISLAGAVEQGLVVAHLLLIFGLVFASFVRGSSEVFSGYLVRPDFGTLNFSKGLLALVTVLWAFEGFNALCFVTNEVRDGEKLAKRITLVGCAVVFVVYAAFLFCVLGRVPFAQLAGEPNAAAALAGLTLGATARYVVFMLSVVGIAAVTHASITIGPRVTKVLADDGRAPVFLSRLHSVHTSPNTALWLQALLTLLYAWIGHFDSVVSAFIAVNWLFYGLTGWGYARVAWGRERERVKRIGAVSAGGVAFFVLASALLVLASMRESPRISGAGLALVLAAWALRRRFGK